MDAVAEPGPDSCALSAEVRPDALTPTQARFLEVQREFAATLRSVEHIAGMAAGVLETSGSVDQLGALIHALGMLTRETIDRGTIFDAVRGTCGSA